METLSPARACQHTALRLATHRTTQFLDVTARLNEVVAASGVRTGLLTVQTRHTTTAVFVNEHEPLLLADFEQLFERTVPQGQPYWHDELPLRSGVGSDEPRNGHAHCRALLLPCSAVLTIVDGRLHLGRWQRVFLAEFDGPRERELSIVVLGEVVL